MLRHVCSRAQAIAASKPECARFFTQIGRGVQVMVLMRRVRISWAPAASDIFDAFIDKVGGREICLTERSYRRGADYCVCALVHELAHANGATTENYPNDRFSHYRCFQAGFLFTGILPIGKNPDFPGLVERTRNAILSFEY
jgi:hypothetical protein